MMLPLIHNSLNTSANKPPGASLQSSIFDLTAHATKRSQWTEIVKYVQITFFGSVWHMKYTMLKSSVVIQVKQKQQHTVGKAWLRSSRRCVISESIRVMHERNSWQYCTNSWCLCECFSNLTVWQTRNAANRQFRLGIYSTTTASNHEYEVCNTLKFM